jgi:hypothetical protein
MGFKLLFFIFLCISKIFAIGSTSLLTKNRLSLGNFYDDIRNYLNFSECTDDELETCLKEVCGAKYDNLISCQNKEETKKWLDKICGDIIIKLDTESIIHEYFN